MQSISKEFRFEAAHRLYHGGLCHRVHGHSYRVRVTVEAEKGQDGIGIPFHVLTEAMRPIVATLDHSLLLDGEDPLCISLENADEPFVRLPFSPTAENMAKYVYTHLQKHSPEDVFRGAIITLWETEKASVTYRRGD